MEREQGKVLEGERTLISTHEATIIKCPSRDHTLYQHNLTVLLSSVYSQILVCKLMRLGRVGWRALRQIGKKAVSAEPKFETPQSAYRAHEAAPDLSKDFYQSYSAALSSEPASSGLLTLCPAPIGNLGDLTFRCYRALLQAGIIACPDLIAARLVVSLLHSYQEHSSSVPSATDEYHLCFSSDSTANLGQSLAEWKERKGRGLIVVMEEDRAGERLSKLIRAMKAGVNVVWTSGEGTPLLGESGNALLTEAINSGVTVDSLPGPTASLSALTSSGFPSDNFLHEGYLEGPDQNKELRLREIQAANCTAMLYVRAHELVNTLAIVEHVFGPLHRIYVGQDLTRKSEAQHYGTCVQIVEKFRVMKKVEGDFSVVISPSGLKNKEKDSEVRVSLRSLVRLVATTSLSARDQMDVLTKLTSLPRTHLSQLLREAKSSKA